MNEIDSWWAHFVSATATVGSLLGIFPAVAGLAAFVYYCITIYESETVQTALERWRKKRHEQRVASLKREVERLNETLQKIDPPKTLIVDP